MKPKFTIIYDNGKPQEIYCLNKTELKAELKKIFQDIKTDYYAYCDLIVLETETEKDITISPQISLMIADIQAEAQADKNISKICEDLK